LTTVQDVEFGYKKRPLLKGKADPVIQQYTYARFYIGLSIAHREMTTPNGMWSIPIPFMRRDRAFLRYKSFEYPTTWGGHKIRTDQMIKDLKNKMAYLQGNDNARLILQSQLDLLLYIDGEKHG